MANTVKICSCLYEIHSKEFRWFDIISTHLLALETIWMIMSLAAELELPAWKNWILIALAYDLGGGAFTHFTYSLDKNYQNI